MKDKKIEDNKKIDEPIEEKKNDEDIEEFEDLDLGVCSPEFQDGCM